MDFLGVCCVNAQPQDSDIAALLAAAQLSPKNKPKLSDSTDSNSSTTSPRSQHNNKESNSAQQQIDFQPAYTALTSALAPVRLQFTQDCKSLLVSSATTHGLLQYKLPPPLSAAERIALQTAALRRSTQASHAAAALVEARLAASHEQRESQREKQFASQLAVEKQRSDKESQEEETEVERDRAELHRQAKSSILKKSQSPCSSSSSSHSVQFIDAQQPPQSPKKLSVTFEDESSEPPQSKSTLSSPRSINTLPSVSGATNKKSTSLSPQKRLKSHASAAALSPLASASLNQSSPQPAPKRQLSSSSSSATASGLGGHQKSTSFDSGAPSSEATAASSPLNGSNSSATSPASLTASQQQQQMKHLPILERISAQAANKVSQIFGQVGTEKKRQIDLENQTAAQKRKLREEREAELKRIRERNATVAEKTQQLLAEPLQQGRRSSIQDDEDDAATATLRRHKSASGDNTASDDEDNLQAQAEQDARDEAALLASDLPLSSELSSLSAEELSLYKKRNPLRSVPPGARPLPQVENYESQFFAPSSAAANELCAPFALSADDSVLLALRRRDNADSAASSCSRLVLVERGPNTTKRTLVCEKSHLAVPHCLAFTSDLRTTLLGTANGHCYAHMYASNNSNNNNNGNAMSAAAASLKWSYVWLTKQQQATDESAIQQLQFSPDNLHVACVRGVPGSTTSLVAHATPQYRHGSVLTVWNAKTWKMASSCEISPAPSLSSTANNNSNAATPSAAQPLVNTCCCAWLDATNLCSLTLSDADCTLRIWANSGASSSSSAAIFPKPRTVAKLNLSPYSRWSVQHAAEAHRQRLADAVKQRDEEAAAASNDATPPANESKIAQPLPSFAPQVLLFSAPHSLLIAAVGLTLTLLHISNSAQNVRLLQTITLSSLWNCAECEAEEASVTPLELSQQLHGMTSPEAAAKLIQQLQQQQDGGFSPTSHSKMSSGSAVDPHTGLGALLQNASLNASAAPAAQTNNKSQQNLSPTSLQLPSIKMSASLTLPSGAAPPSNSHSPTTAKSTSPGRTPGRSRMHSRRPSLDKNRELLQSMPVSPLIAQHSTAATLQPLQYETHINALALSADGKLLAYTTSLGSTGVLEMSAAVLRGEKETTQCDDVLMPLRYAAMQQRARSRHALLERYRESVAVRRANALERAAAREAETEAFRAARADRLARRAEREDLRRRHLYAGDGQYGGNLLPEDLVRLLDEIQAKPRQLIAFSSFNRQAHQAKLAESIQSQGSFLNRLESDLATRNLKKQAQLQQKLAEEDAAIAQTQSVTGPPQIIKQRQSDFLQRLQKDADKRKEFERKSSTYYASAAQAQQQSQLLLPTKKLGSSKSSAR